MDTINDYYLNCMDVVDWYNLDADAELEFTCETDTGETTVVILEEEKEIKAIATIQTKDGRPVVNAPVKFITEPIRRPRYRDIEECTPTLKLSDIEGKAWISSSLSSGYKISASVSRPSED